jgi:hypothetical protein
MKTFINKIKNFLYPYKEIIASILIFFLPFFIYLRPNNLKQLNFVDIKIILFGHISLFFCILILSFFTNKFIRQFVNTKFSVILFLFCVFFYLQFFYIFFEESFELNYLYILIVFEIISLSFVIIIYNFKKSFIKFTIIYSTILITYYTLSIVSFHLDLNNYEFKSKKSLNAVNIPESHIHDKRNVYYLIFDGMMSLKLASELNIVDEKKELINLNNLKLRYINKSFSNYNKSHITLASIFKLDYPQNQKDLPPKELNNFFPFKLYTATETNLLRYLKKVNVNFFWGGNNAAPCREINLDINCLENDLINNTFNMLLKFYFNTPINKFYYNNFKKLDNPIYPSETLINKIQLNDKQKNNFYFIHNLSPHNPYIFNSDCSIKKNKDEDYFNGYKDNYICALQKIQNIMEKLNHYDPNAIILIQGDHGWEQIGVDLDDKQLINYRAKIFNAIKAPDECFNKFGFPNTTINTIRFVMNCAYGFEFKKMPNFHSFAIDDRSVLNETHSLEW